MEDFDGYYPEGGVEDIKLRTDARDEAVQIAKTLSKHYEYVQMYNVTTGETEVQHNNPY
jgi:hypothetical protein